MGKTKKDKEEMEIDVKPDVPDEMTYEQKLEFVSIIAKPMASKKLTKKCYKLIKKGKCNYKHISVESTH